MQDKKVVTEAAKIITMMMSLFDSDTTCMVAVLLNGFYSEEKPEQYAAAKKLFSEARTANSSSK